MWLMARMVKRNIHAVIALHVNGVEMTDAQSACLTSVAIKNRV